MVDDVENERFDVDNDFEGGQFIGGEFFYEAKRQKRQQTRDDSLYGVFAEGSSDEDEGRGRRRAKKEKADFAKPVAFVSKGAMQTDEQRPAHENSDGRANIPTQGHSRAPLPGLDEEDPVGDGNGRSGLGAGGTGLGFGGPGLGAAAGPGADRDAQSGGGGHQGIGFTANGRDTPEAGLDWKTIEADLPKSFIHELAQEAEQRRNRTELKAKQERARTSAAKSDAMSFDKSGKLLRMMMKQGFQLGQGLGKDGQGITQAIDSKQRPKSMGLGYNDFQEHKLIKTEETSKDAVAAAKPSNKGMWHAKQTSQRKQRKFKTPEELLQESAQKGAMASAASVAQPILDMRGKQAKLVTNLEHLNMDEEEGPTGDTVPMPELQHNLKLLVDMAEADIQRLDAKIRMEKDTAVLLGREQQRLQQKLDTEFQGVQRAQYLVAELERCQHAGPAMMLDDLQRTFERLKTTYPEEYVLYNLNAVALACALPKLTVLMATWDPLARPDYGAAVIKSWKRLLQGQAAEQGQVLRSADGSSSDPFVQLIGEVLLPPLRTAIVNRWEPRDPGPLEAFMEVWEDVIPPASLQYALQSLILPRLRTAVNAWDPLKDTVALHVWIHPWLPYLGDALSELWPTIRFKFTAALEGWQAWDTSALVILTPWHKVFDASAWEALLARSIVPRLAQGLQQLVINPAQQNMEPFNWVMAWADVMPDRLMVQLLETGFFPQWYAVLQHWLANSPNYDEVTRWYLGWKAAFPQDLQDQPRLRTLLAGGLNMINSNADGNAALPPQPPPQAAPVPPMPQSHYGAYPTEQYANMPGAHMPSWAANLSGEAVDLSLRGLVEQFAIENNVALVPKPGRVHLGLQVYSFGPVSIVLDSANSSILAQQGTSWFPVSLESLMAQVRSRRAAAQKQL